MVEDGGAKKKKGLRQDLLLDDFFKPPAEDEQSQQIKKEDRAPKKTSMKKDLLLDDFFKPPAEEVSEKAPPVSQKESKSPSVYSQIKTQKTPPPVPPEKEESPLPELDIASPPSKSLNELLNEPLSQEKNKGPAMATPMPYATPAFPKAPGLHVTDTAKATGKFPFVPVAAGSIILILIIAGGAFFLLKKKEVVQEVKSTRAEVMVNVPPPPEPKTEQKIEIPPSGATAQPEDKPSDLPAPKDVPKPAPMVSPSASTAKVSLVFVEAGPYKSKDEAKAGEIKAKIFGFKTEIKSGKQAIDEYALFIEHPLSQGEAKIAELKLKLKGFSPELIPEGEMTKVKVGYYQILSEAISQKNTAAEIGYGITIDIGKKRVPVFFIRMGFSEKKDAIDAVGKLKDLGLQAQIVSKGG